jgi:hypothetical protein
MRDDLLDAQAAIDWPVSNFPSLEQRLAAWVNANVYLDIIDHDPQSPNKIVVAREKSQLPRSFNVEVGAYINCLRSSLDLLAYSLATRFGIARLSSVYFPVAAHPHAFIDGNYKGHEFVDGLPEREADIIKSLEPYKGGNDTLWALHDFDIQRKHHNLLAAEVRPSHFTIATATRFYTPVATGWMRVSDEETVIGILSKDAPNPDMTLSAQIVFSEVEAMINPAVMPALRDFASLCNLIIALFDA